MGVTSRILKVVGSEMQCYILWRRLLAAYAALECELAASGTVDILGISLRHASRPGATLQEEMCA